MGITATLFAPESFSLDGSLSDEPSEVGWVRVRVRECGVCGSDIKMYSGHHPIHVPPLRLGHEIVGSLTDSEDSGEVAVFPAVGCGQCYACRAGSEQLCPEMRLIGGHLPGGLSEYVWVPSRNAIPIPDGVPVDARVLIEPMSVALHGVDLGQARPDDSVLVIGAGPIGLFAAMALHHQGVRGVLVVDLDEARVEMARRIGVPAEVVGADELAAWKRYSPDGDGFEVVLDCAGGRDTHERAVQSLTPGGTAVLLGVPPAVIGFDSIALQRSERTIKGSMMYSRENFVQAMRMLADEVIPREFFVAGLIRKSYPMAKVQAAFDDVSAGRAQVLKVVITSE